MQKRADEAERETGREGNGWSEVEAHYRVHIRWRRMTKPGGRKGPGAEESLDNQEILTKEAMNQKATAYGREKSGERERRGQAEARARRRWSLGAMSGDGGVCRHQRKIQQVRTHVWRVPPSEPPPSQRPECSTAPSARHRTVLGLSSIVLPFMINGSL